LSRYIPILHFWVDASVLQAWDGLGSKNYSGKSLKKCFPAYLCISVEMEKYFWLGLFLVLKVMD